MVLTFSKYYYEYQKRDQYPGELYNSVYRFSLVTYLHTVSFKMKYIWNVLLNIYNSLNTVFKYLLNILNRAKCSMRPRFL